MRAVVAVEFNQPNSCTVFSALFMAISVSCVKLCIFSLSWLLHRTGDHGFFLQQYNESHFVLDSQLFFLRVVCILFLLLSSSVAVRTGTQWHTELVMACLSTNTWNCTSSFFSISFFLAWRLSAPSAFMWESCEAIHQCIIFSLMC